MLPSELISLILSYSDLKTVRLFSEWGFEDTPSDEEIIVNKLSSLTISVIEKFDNHIDVIDKNDTGYFIYEENTEEYYFLFWNSKHFVMCKHKISGNYRYLLKNSIYYTTIPYFRKWFSKLFLESRIFPQENENNFLTDTDYFIIENDTIFIINEEEGTIDYGETPPLKTDGFLSYHSVHIRHSSGDLYIININQKQYIVEFNVGLIRLIENDNEICEYVCKYGDEYQMIISKWGTEEILYQRYGSTLLSSIKLDIPHEDFTDYTILNNEYLFYTINEFIHKYNLETHKHDILDTEWNITYIDFKTGLLIHENTLKMIEY